MSKHRNAGLTPFQTLPMSSKKCQRFRFEHIFTSMTPGMTKSGKAAWVLSLLHQASKAIYLPPERIVWCYSQWQPAYPGGGTLGISGWGCAAGSLEPLTFTRASSA